MSPQASPIKVCHAPCVAHPAPRIPARRHAHAPRTRARDARPPNGFCSITRTLAHCNERRGPRRRWRRIARPCRLCTRRWAARSTIRAARSTIRRRRDRSRWRSMASFRGTARCRSLAWRYVDGCADAGTPGSNLGSCRARVAAGRGSNLPYRAGLHTCVPACADARAGR